MRLPRLMRRIGPERALAAALLAALVALRVWDPAPVEYLRLKTFDLMQLAKPRAVPADGPAVIIDIDEASLKAHGQWPWPRVLIAELVSKIAAAGTKAIALDVLFAEPDRLSGPQLAASLPGADEETRARLQRLPDGEVTLAAAMRTTRVIAGAAGYNAEMAGVAGDLPPSRIAILGSRIEPYLPRYPGLLRSRPEIEAAAAGIGVLTVRPDRDGVVRRAPALLVAHGRVLPALDIELLRAGLDAPNLLVRSDAAGVRSVAIAGRELPTDRRGQLTINFSPHHASRFVSAADVLAGRVAPNRLAGKLAFVGSSAVALFDLRATPLDAVMPGVEIHAQLIENILGDALLSRPNYAIGAEIVVALALGLVIIAAVPVLGALPVLILGGVIAIAVALGSWLLFARSLTLIDVSFPLLASAATFLLLTFANYWREETRRTQIRNAFGQYVSPALVERLAREPDRLKLGGESREMTILFSDVRGFTTISEAFRDDPQGLVTLMNGLLTPLTNAVLDRRGTIDKYMGDALLAFWNAPLDDPQHPSNACLAALDMIERLGALNARREADAQRDGKLFLPIDIGVGINTGLCVVGNMGSDLRFDYSVLGDSVNIASRLEALTKGYGVSILIGSQTAKAVAGAVATLPIDRIRVKGKTEPETIHMVVGPAALAAQPWFAALGAALQQVRDAYAEARWSDASAALAACRRLEGVQKLGRVPAIYAERLERLSGLADVPPGWDGVYTFASKEG